MASPPALTDGDIESWGPDAQPNQVRVHRVVDLIAAQLDLPVDVAADMLMELKGRHRYVLLEKLGRSKHAVVYVAIDQMLAREVALKIHLDPATSSGKWNAFKEARTQVLFDHPNVVRILDVGAHEGLSYTVTELCDADMSVWARGKPWRVVLRRIVEAGRGLEVLHSANVVHCDVKPANILIKEGKAKIGDFGLSAQSGRAMRVAGTPGFIAPEVVAGFRTAAGDVFALAVSAWVCLFGELPFEVPTQAELDEAESVMLALVERAREGRLVELAEGSEVPLGVVEVIRTGLVAVPQQRPSMGEWLRRVEVACGERAKPGRRWVPGFAAGLAVGGLSMLLVTVALLSPRSAEETAVPRAPETADRGVVPPPGADDAPEQRPPPAFVDYVERKGSQPLTIEETQGLAESLIRAAESMDPAAQVTWAKAARYVAGDLWIMAENDGDELTREAAKDLIEQADQIIKNSR